MQKLIISEFLTLNNTVTLKSSLWVTQSHWKLHHLTTLFEEIRLSSSTNIIYKVLYPILIRPIINTLIIGLLLLRHQSCIFSKSILDNYPMTATVSFNATLARD